MLFERKRFWRRSLEDNAGFNRLGLLKESGLLSQPLIRTLNTAISGRKFYVRFIVDTRV